MASSKIFLGINWVKVKKNIIGSMESMEELTAKLSTLSSDDVVIEEAEQVQVMPEMDEILSKCFLIGTEKHLSWWTAKECARQQGQEECERLVAQYQVVVDGVVTDGGEVGTSLSAEEKEILKLYQATVDTDRVDHDLILHLLVHFHTQQVEGAVLVFLSG